MPMRVGREILAMQARAARFDGTEYLFVHTPDLPTVPLIRLHSGCVTGDVFASQRCDCGAQLEAAWTAIAASACGGVLYVPGHEGRGIGLFNKIVAYGLQEEGADTFEANRRLGFPDDARDFAGCAAVLLALGHNEVDLLSNNPAKSSVLEAHGLRVRCTVPLIAGVSSYNRGYLEAKRDQHGHSLSTLPSSLESCDPTDAGVR
jgi:GTP cyclohydrolase II